MTTYASKTEVSSERSRMEIERTLTRYGADQFMYGWQNEAAILGFRMQNRMVRFILPMPDPNDRKYTHHSRGKRTPEAARKEYEQATRQRWRALSLVVKAKLEAVESQITTFEEEFMAQIVLPNGQTVAEQALPRIRQAYETGDMPNLLPHLN